MPRRPNQKFICYNSLAGGKAKSKEEPCAGAGG